MEIVSVSGQSLRIKGKQVTTVINPLPGKSTAEVVLFFNRPHEAVTDATVENLKLVVDGPGEYEMGGMKITGQKIGDAGIASDIVYWLLLDGVEILIAKATTSAKMKDSARDCQIAVLFSDGLVDQAFVTSLNAAMTIFYGEQAVANAKAFGKEEIVPQAKVTITREKLPTESEIVVL